MQGGYSLAHAVMMMIPEAWAGNPLMDDERRAFYEYNAALMEPWDGPAAIAFTDGRQIGATLDRNGLRPARYLVTRDDRILMASEMGVLPIPEEDIVTKWRLQPGKMLLVDLEEGRLIPDEEIKTEARAPPSLWGWLDHTQIILEDLPPAEPDAAPISNLSLLDRQQAFGYTQEDLKILMSPMATTGEEAVGSMGNDTPISALSDRPKLLFTYFKQNFAQVTNPPIDPIREELVMSLVSIIGPRPNLFDLEGIVEDEAAGSAPADSHQRRSGEDPLDLGGGRRAFQIAHARYDLAGRSGAPAWAPPSPTSCGRPSRRCAMASTSSSCPTAAPAPIAFRCRRCSPARPCIIILSATACAPRSASWWRSGEPREVHHFCCLAGYGAEAINPYLAFETLIGDEERAAAEAR